MLFQFLTFQAPQRLNNHFPTTDSSTYEPTSKMSAVSLTPSDKSIDQNLANLSLSSPIKKTDSTASSTNINITSDNSKLNLLKSVHSIPTISQQYETIMTNNNQNENENGNNENNPLTNSLKLNLVSHNHSSSDPDSGFLQNQDKLINQSQLNSIIKKDMKRKRLDSHTNIKSINPLTSLDQVQSTTTTTTTTTTHQPSREDTKPLSATARIMLKLYGDKSQLARESTSEESKVAPATQLQQQQQQHRIASSISSNNNNNTHHHTTSYTVNVLKTLNQNTERSTTRLPDLKKLKTPSEQQLNADNFYKMKMKPNYKSSNTSLSSSSSSSSEANSNNPMNRDGFDGDIKDSIFNDNVEVILKWKDHLQGVDSSTKISIISKDMVSTLYSLQDETNPSPTHFHRETNSLNMTFDPVTSEWYMKDLFLPPGIYKLQFLINGNLYHSDYLPTATNTMGNIVNWFEVLPGYDTVEPYREENTIVNDSVSLSHNDHDKSVTSLTDFAGISRSSSTLNKRGSNSSLRLFGLHGFTTLDKEEPKVKYSNEIPEIFKFDNIDEDEDYDDNDKVDDNFDLTLSRVVDLNQDSLFANIQKIAKMNTEEAEEYFLSKFKVPDLPIYLNSTYLNKNFNNDNQVNNIIPHVNLKHLLTTSIKDNIVCVGCTTRYEGKFVTQVIYAPCDFEK